MVSLDGGQTTVTTIPNIYTYYMIEKLSPTEYQSVLAEEFVFLDFFETLFSFVVGRYRIQNGTSGVISEDKFQVYTTAVYTALLYNTDDAKVSN